MSANAKPTILWNNLLAATGATLTASGGDDGTNAVANLADWREYLTWQSGSASAQNVAVELSAAAHADCAAIYNHNLFTSGVTEVSIEVSDNGSDWTEVEDYAVASDDPIFIKFPTQEDHAYYRLVIGAGSTSPSIGVLFIGELMEFPRWPSNSYDPHNVELITERGTSETGLLLGEVEKYRKRKLSLQFKNLSSTWIEQTWNVFWDAHVPEPVLLLWDYTNHATDIYLVSLKPSRNAPFNRTLRDLTIEMEGRVA